MHSFATCLPRKERKIKVDLILQSDGSPGSGKAVSNFRISNPNWASSDVHFAPFAAAFLGHRSPSAEIQKAVVVVVVWWRRRPARTIQGSRSLGQSAPPHLVASLPPAPTPRVVLPLSPPRVPPTAEAGDGARSGGPGPFAAAAAVAAAAAATRLRPLCLPAATRGLPSGTQLRLLARCCFRGVSQTVREAGGGGVCGGGGGGGGSRAPVGGRPRSPAAGPHSWACPTAFENGIAAHEEEQDARCLLSFPLVCFATEHPEKRTLPPQQERLTPSSLQRPLNASSPVADSGPCRTSLWTVMP